MDERSEQIAKRFEVPVFVACLLVVPLLIIENSSLGQPWKTIGTILNWGTWLAFVLEIVVMLAVVPKRFQWIRKHKLEIAITILTPPVLPPGLAGADVLRFLRVFRLLRIPVLARQLFTLNGVRYAALLALLTLIAGGSAFANIESNVSEWDGIWWAAATMTTVGYGDLYPHTDLGRILAMVMMIVGIGFVSLLIGAVAERFLTKDVQNEAKTIESNEAEILLEVRNIAERLARIEAELASRRS